MTDPSFDAFVVVLRRVFNQHNLSVSRETRSVDVPGWDSLSHVMLILELQAEFGADIQPDETLELKNTGQLYDFLIGRISGAMIR